MNLTIVIIIITSIVSLMAFSNTNTFNKLKFNAYIINNNREWFRFFTHALIHADWMHLIINMFVLYSFGSVVEEYFLFYFGSKAILYFLTLYIGSIVVSSIPSYEKNKNNAYYNAVGASGAVSAILFASILFYPTGKIMLILLPVPIPSFVFGALYLIYSAYMAKKNLDNVGHDAHFYGAIFGFLLTILYKPKLFLLFIAQIMQYFGMS
jgi:membrane associated rhomboid family serine protease